jgi:hypothetical protein
MIALQEFDPRNKVDSNTEAALYAKTRDAGLAKILGQTKVSDYSSSPVNMQVTAKDNGVKAILYEKDDIPALAGEIETLKTVYVKPLNPAKVNTAGMKNLMDKGPLQAPRSSEWESEANALAPAAQGWRQYYLYDTAYGTNQVDADEILRFNAQFTTGRQNNFSALRFI